MSFKLDKNNKDLPKSKPVGQVANSFFDKIIGEIGNTPAYKQIAMGASSGWISGFLAIRVGKTAALALGGGIILLEIANEKGYIKIRWDKVNRKADKVVNKIKNVTNQDPTWADKIVQFAKTNTPFSSGFIGGFLIGLASH